MNARERGILVGLAIVLGAAVIFILVKGKGGDEIATPGVGGALTTAPSEWDLSRLPLREALREFDTPGGARVLVLREGKGEPTKKGEAMDIDYRGFTAKSGAQFERGVMKGLVLARGGVIQGWIEGLAGIKRREQRRILIPSALGYGSQRRPKLAPNTDLVFDVEWVHLDINDLKVGSGDVAKRGSKVFVHYKGTLENGVEFDSSYKRGEPADFTLERGRLIDGWIKGIPGMRVGGTRKLWVPWHLAYGDRGKGKKIGPYANLIFVIELLGVE